MTRLHLIRHAKPAASWSEASDPGLDNAGHEQAASAAAELAARISGAQPIYTSPLLRCCQTAAPLERLWQHSAQLLPEVAEIPSPPLPLEQRHLWLQRAMTGTWLQLQQEAASDWPDYLEWRRALLERVALLPEDSVIFSHFIAINVIVAAARNEAAVVCFRPDHASISIIDVHQGKFELVALGREAETLVLARASAARVQIEMPGTQQ
jgi:broad specificity phosphatase PhoE